MDPDLRLAGPPPSNIVKPVVLQDPFKPDPTPVKLPVQPKRKFKVLKLVLPIVGLVLLLASNFAVYIWQHKKVSNLADQNQSLSNIISSQNSDNSKDSATKTTPPVASNIFKIPELGIQLTVPDSLKDLTYTIRSGNYDDDSTFIAANVSSAALTAADKNCASSATPALGGLFRSEGTGPTVDQGDTAPPVPLKQFTGFYVGQNFGQASCSDNKTIQASLAKARADYKTALGSIQLIQ